MTGRVFIREPTGADASRFAELVEASLESWAPWVTWDVPPVTKESAAAYLQGQNPQRRRRYLICRRDDAAIMGLVNLNEIVRGYFQSAYLAYLIGRPYEGQGYMTEGLGRVLDEVFGKLGLHRLEANIQPNNEASRQLVQRCGFRLEGMSPKYLKIDGDWRDHERWAILAEEWEAHRMTWATEMLAHSNREHR